MSNTTITAQDRNQCFTVEWMTNAQTGRTEYRVLDNVTNQRVAVHFDRAAAQRECDARNTDHCHSLATGYSVQELPFWQRETGENWRVIDTRRAEGYEATTALAKVAITEANARLVAEWANRTQPAWYVSTVEALELTREYFAGRLAATLDVLDF
jgi:hypothetical protein